jgi:hypothetical protein
VPTSGSGSISPYESHLRRIRAQRAQAEAEAEAGAGAETRAGAGAGAGVGAGAGAGAKQTVDLVSRSAPRPPVHVSASSSSSASAPSEGGQPRARRIRHNTPPSQVIDLTDSPGEGEGEGVSPTKMSLEELHRQLSVGLAGRPSSIPAPSAAVERRRQRLGLGAEAAPAVRGAPSHLATRIADDDDDAVLQAALQASLLDTRPPGRPTRAFVGVSSSSSSFGHHASRVSSGAGAGAGAGRDDRWARPPPRPSSASFGAPSQIALQDLDLGDEDDDLLAQAIRESLR